MSAHSLVDFKPDCAHKLRIVLERLFVELIVAHLQLLNAVIERVWVKQKFAELSRRVLPDQLEHPVLFQVIFNVEYGDSFVDGRVHLSDSSPRHGLPEH